LNKTISKNQSNDLKSERGGSMPGLMPGLCAQNQQTMVAVEVRRWQWSSIATSICKNNSPVLRSSQGKLERKCLFFGHIQINVQD
jgi:hypothetical protein